MPLLVPLPDVVISKDAKPHHWAFRFQCSRVLISCCGTWFGSVHSVHISLQELPAVALMLCKMAFQLSGKVVTLLLDSITVNANLCNQSGAASLFPD